MTTPYLSHPWSGIYQHYKGGLYTVLFLAYNSTNSADREPMVVYVSHTTGGIFVREEKEFMEMVTREDGITCPRFQYMGLYERPEKRTTGEG